MADKEKAPTRKEMDELYEIFKDEAPSGFLLPVGKEGKEKIMKALRKIRNMKEGGPAAPIMPEKAKKIRKYRSTRNDKTELPKQVRDFIAAQESGSIPDDAIAPKEKGATLQELYDQGVIYKRPKNMEKGGEAVPAKFKGFSKLPEKVQQKMDPNLAQKYEKGGGVGSCRGMGAAMRGGKFSGVK